MVPKDRERNVQIFSTQKPNLILTVSPVDKMRLRHLDKLPNLRRIAVRAMIREPVVLSTLSALNIQQLRHIAGFVSHFKSAKKEIANRLNGLNGSELCLN